MELVLSLSQAIEVHVIDQDDNPVANALVKRAGAGGKRGSSSRLEQYVQDSAISDKTGTARLPSLAGDQAIWAEKDFLASTPWQGKSPSRVSLRLRPTFTVGGTLRTVRRDWGGYIGERSLVVSERRGNLWIPVVRLRGLADGNWGPVLVPLGSGDEFEVRLEGIPIAPVVHRFAPPQVGGLQHFDLIAEKGQCELWVFILDEHQSPLADAEIAVWWEQPLPHSGPNFVRATPRPDGACYVGTFPAGVLQYEATAPGYAPYRGEVIVPSDTALDLALKPGGEVAGHVTAFGVPVRDFQLVYWPEGNVRSNRSMFCFDREDGQFELGSLTPGEWRIQVATPELPPSRTIIAQVVAGNIAEVTVALDEPLIGGGRVVDREIGEPIPDATVQVFGEGGKEFGVPWLPPFACRQDGTFELESFRMGSNYLLVSAPGYAESSVKKSATENFVDWGDIRLARPQSLEVQLLGLDEFKGNLSDLSGRSVLGFELPFQRFDRSGALRYEGVPPGDLQFVIEEGASAWSRLQLRLEAGEEWTFEHRIAGGKRLDVRLVDSEGEILLVPRGVYASGVEPTGVTTLRSLGRHMDGVYSFDGLGSDTVQVMVLEAGVVQATQTVALGSERLTQVDLVLGSSPFRVCVFDSSGRTPLSGAWFNVRSANGERVLGSDDTDSSGWAELAGVPAERLIADVYHDVAGWRFGVPIDASVREQEFVLAAEGSLALKLVEGDVPLADVTTRIETPSGTVLTRPRPTGADGTVRYEPLGQGQYRIVGRRSDCWPVVADIALAAGEHTTPTVRMRRLAELELLVRSAEGTPLVGVEVALRSLEFGSSVADWVAGKAVEGELRTDKDGKLRLKGLPSGPFAWSVSAPVAAGGSIELAPGANVLDVGRGL
ncbi:MAG: hypothetical protein ABL998_05740 [Planctomycetota bacterium]